MSLGLQKFWTKRLLDFRIIFAFLNISVQNIHLVQLAECIICRSEVFFVVFCQIRNPATVKYELTKRNFLYLNLIKANTDEKLDKMLFHLMLSNLYLLQSLKEFQTLKETVNSSIQKVSNLNFRCLQGKQTHLFSLSQKKRDIKSKK